MRVGFTWRLFTNNDAKLGGQAFVVDALGVGGFLLVLGACACPQNRRDAHCWIAQFSSGFAVQGGDPWVAQGAHQSNSHLAFIFVCLYCRGVLGLGIGALVRRDSSSDALRKGGKRVERPIVGGLF